MLRYGDAWAPQHRHGNAAERIPELRRRAEEAGRGHIPVTIFGVPADAERARLSTRKPAPTASCAGCRAAQRGPVERELERFEDAVRELRGE